MKMTYRQWLRLLFAKGYKLETVEEEVRGLGFKRGFSKTSLSTKGKTDKPAPPRLVEYAWTTKLLGSQEEFESYARHLASVGVEIPAELRTKFATPPPPRVDPEEIAEGLTPKLEALLSPMGERLDSALSALAGKLDTVAASLRGKMDAFALATESKLDSLDARLGRIHADADEHGRELSSAHLKLAMVDGSVASAARTLNGVKTTVNETHAKVDALDVKLDQNRRVTIRAIWTAAGGVAMLVGALVLLPSRSHASNCAEPMQLVASVEPDGTTVVDNPRWWLGVTTAQNQMGEKPPKERLVPVKPFPGQKLAKDCDPAAGEAAINGGCWVPIAGMAPPCGAVLFRQGNLCYRPVAADPQKPVGTTP